MTPAWSLYTFFEESVFRYPQRPALEVDGNPLSYLELYRMVATLHRELEHIPFHETRIGVYCLDSAWTYAAMLAVAAHGASYLPVNPVFPPAYNQIILEKSGVKTLLAIGAGQIPLDGLGLRLVTAIQTRPEPLPARLTPRISQEEAYLIFTSGTTGAPKGVPVSKSNVRAFFDFFLAPGRYDFGEEDRFLQVYDLNFDVSVFSCFLPLYLGACCYSVPMQGIRWMEILRMLREKSITVVSLVPTILQFWERYLPEVRLDTLRYSFFSGDRLMHHLALEWQRCLPRGVIHNFYGPTETTVVCTRYLWNEDLSAQESLHGVVPIGEPFEGMSFVLVDEEGSSLRQTGIAGELCFSGTQTITGYLNGEHEEKFLFVEQQGKKMRYYRTGDLASLNERGQLIFHGRTDRQVKINGFRVELAQVEHQLLAVTGNFSAVVAGPDLSGMQVLTAFVEGKVDEPLVRRALSLQLPAYMIPRTIVPLEKMPLTRNGKLDWQFLDQLASTPGK